MKKYILIIAVFASLSFFTSPQNLSCKEVRTELEIANAKLKNFSDEGLNEVEDFRIYKAELSRLQFEIQYLKIRNSELSIAVDSLKKAK